MKRGFVKAYGKEIGGRTAIHHISMVRNGKERALSKFVGEMVEAIFRIYYGVLIEP